MTRTLATLALTAFTYMSTTASGAELLAVTLQSGRSFTAAVDERTDDARLWLRFGSEGAVLFRPIAWESVTAAWRNGEPLVLMELRQEAEAMKSTFVRAETPATQAIEEVSPLSAQPDAPALIPIPQVVSIAFDANYANFDADAAVDGLIVVIRPLDAWGNFVASGGVAEIALTGAVRRTFQSAPHAGGRVLENLGRWTKPLHTAIPTPDGYLLKLPFPGNHRDELLASSRGRVYVRLTVPGNGVFEDVREGVVIQPFSPLRDEWLRAGGFDGNWSGR